MINWMSTRLLSRWSRVQTSAKPTLSNVSKELIMIILCSLVIVTELSGVHENSLIRVDCAFQIEKEVGSVGL